MEIKGFRVTLREILMSDLSYYLEWRNNKEIFKFLGGGFNPVTEEKMEEILFAMIKDKDKNIRFTITNEAEIPIGMIGLYNIEKHDKISEVGMYLGDVKSHGKGYASEAYQLLEKFAKKTLEIEKIKLYVVVSNEKAITFWKKQGFIEQSILLKNREIDSKLYDVLVMMKHIS